MTQDAHMPGAWICDQCGFILQKNILHTLDGSVSADGSPLNNPCPNDNVLMRPLTWREANQSLYAALLKAEERLNWLDQHCAFVADYEYNLGPFKRGELRLLADAGISADVATKNRPTTHTA